MQRAYRIFLATAVKGNMVFSRDVFFNNCHVINLPRREDRWMAISKDLRAKNFTVKRFEAVDGQLVLPKISSLLSKSAKETLKRGFRYEHHEVSPGSVGCSLSHMSLWRLLVESGEPHMTIMEDDALCTGDLEGAVATLEKRSGESSVVLLGGLYDDSRSGLNQQHHFQMLHAYVIWPDAARKLLATAFPISKQVDWYMMDILKGEIEGFSPSVFEQNPAVYWTDIQTTMKPTPVLSPYVNIRRVVSVTLVGVLLIFIIVAAWRG